MNADPESSADPKFPSALRYPVGEADAGTPVEAKNQDQYPAGIRFRNQSRPI
jgi:hypothetical protein